MKPRNRDLTVNRVASRFTREGKYVVSNLYTILQATICLATYTALALLSLHLNTWKAWIFIWPVQSFLLAGFLGASHDCAHRAHYTSPSANRLAGMFWATLGVVNFTLYKHFHLDHHQFVGTDKDTEPAGEFDSVTSYLRSLPTIHFFLTFWKMSVNSLFGRHPHFIRNQTQRNEVIQDTFALLIWMTLVVVAAVIWTKVTLITYVIPVLLYFPMVFIFSLPEHYGCQHNEDWRENTRTITSNRVIAYLYWNGNYHADHHIFPRLPSRHLPYAHSLIRNELKFVGKSYLMFHIKLIMKLSSNGASDSFEDGVMKVLSPSERIHFTELTDMEAATKTPPGTKPNLEE